MTSSHAVFAVAKVFELAARNAVVLEGDIRTGVVLAGMTTKVLVDSQLYMTAKIRAVDFIDGPGGKSAVGLVLDTPEPEVRELWLALCQPGDVLPIESA